MLRAFGVGLFIVAVYISFLTCAHYWDAVLFSYYIENVRLQQMDVSVLFHPNHLLYNAAGYVLYDMLSPLHLRAITCLQIFNACCGAVAAVLVRHLAYGITQSKRIAIMCAVLFAFGATWWKFSTDGGSYVPATLLVLLAVRAALRGRSLEAAIFHVAALLFHELAVFAALPIVFALAMRRRSAAALYSVVTALATLGIYEAIFRATGPHVQSNLLGWVTSFSSEAKMTHTWGQILVTYPLSYAKLFLGGKLSLVRDFFSLPVALFLFAAAALVVTSAWMFRRPTSEEAEVRVAYSLKATLWLWVLPYAIFLIWWEPGNAFYKLLCWPAIVLLLGVFLAEHDWTRPRVLPFMTLVAAIACWNFAAFIYPHTRSSSDAVYEFALRLNEQLPKKATVLYRVFSPDDWYLAYFAPGRNWRAAPQGRLSEETPTCLETSALADPLLDRSGWKETKTWTLIDDKHHVRVSCFARSGTVKN